MDKSNVKSTMNGEDTSLEKAKHVASDVLHTLKDKAHNFQEKATHLQEEATSFAKEKYAKARDTSSELGDKIVTYTKENPLKAVGIAAIAGAVIAKLFSSRK